MNFRKHFFVLNIVLVCFLTYLDRGKASAQGMPAADTLKMDSIFFLNGDVQAVRIIDTVNNTVKFFPQKKKRRVKLQEAETANIFSLKYYHKTEKIVYFHDSAIGNVFTVLEAKMYMLGEQEADRNYKNKWPFIIGLASGLVSPLVLSNAVLLSPIAPVVMPFHTRIPHIRINKKLIKDVNHLQYDTYLMGYERSARKKNFVNSLIGSGIGLTLGIGIWVIMK